MEEVDLGKNQAIVPHPDVDPNLERGAGESILRAVGLGLQLNDEARRRFKGNPFFITADNPDDKGLMELNNGEPYWEPHVGFIHPATDAFNSNRDTWEKLNHSPEDENPAKKQFWGVPEVKGEIHEGKPRTIEISSNSDGGSNFNTQVLSSGAGNVSLDETGKILVQQGGHWRSPTNEELIELNDIFIDTGEKLDELQQLWKIIDQEKGADPGLDPDKKELSPSRVQTSGIYYIDNNGMPSREILPSVPDEFQPTLDENQLPDMSRDTQIHYDYRDTIVDNKRAEVMVGGVFHGNKGEIANTAYRVFNTLPYSNTFVQRYASEPIEIHFDPSSPAMFLDDIVQENRLNNPDFQGSALFIAHLENHPGIEVIFTIDQNPNGNEDPVTGDTQDSLNVNRGFRFYNRSRFSKGQDLEIGFIEGLRDNLVEELQRNGFTIDAGVDPQDNTPIDNGMVYLPTSIEDTPISDTTLEGFVTAVSAKRIRVKKGSGRPMTVRDAFTFKIPTDLSPKRTQQMLEIIRDTFVNPYVGDMEKLFHT